jgi:adenosylcobyric acid synthase
VLRLPTGEALGVPAAGYEIHHGRVTRGPEAEEFLGGARQGHVLGTMWHGSLESDELRSALLCAVAGLTGRAWTPAGVSFPAARERRLELLADLVEEHLDVDALLGIADGADFPAPVLPPGASR